MNQVQNVITDPTLVVREAIKNTPIEYWRKICASRSETDPAHAGSFFKHFPPIAVSTFIEDLEWEPYSHVAVQAPTRAFIATSTPIGMMGVIHISTIPEKTNLIFEDPKETGKVEATWTTGRGAVPIDFTVILLGIHPETGKDVVFTFFPGDPVSPSQVQRHVELMDGPFDRHGTNIRADLAKELGVEWVKLKPLIHPV